MLQNLVSYYRKFVLVLIVFFCYGLEIQQSVSTNLYLNLEKDRCFTERFSFVSCWDGQFLSLDFGTLNKFTKENSMNFIVA